MSRVRRAITAFFCYFFLFSSIIFFILFLLFFRVCVPPPFPQILGVCVCLCVCVGGRVGGRVDVQARVVYVSVCVCCTQLFSFFTLAFVLVNDLSLVSCCSCFGNAYDYYFLFYFFGGAGGLCCCLFLFVVCTCILCLLPCHTRYSFTDVLSCTPTGVSETNLSRRRFCLEELRAV